MISVVTIKILNCIFPIWYCILASVFNFFNVYLLWRKTERQSVSGRGAEGDTESKSGSNFWQYRADIGLKLRNHEIMTWDEVWHLTLLSHSGTPDSVL